MNLWSAENKIALFDTLGEHLAFEFPAKDPEELAKRWVKELDRHGLARSVLIASVPGDEDFVQVFSGNRVLDGMDRDG